MKEITETTENIERFILVGVERGNDNMEASLAELHELLKTAGGESAGTVIQNLESFNKATYIGTGKVEELKEMLADTGADGIITDDELSPAQMKNLEDALGCKVLDRTMLILDIFAKHAVTGEGKIQVEMAQLKYRSSRLQGFGTSLSRLGGRIGTRGPGESKLESDRRTIRNRISQLSKEINDVRAARDTARKKRLANAVPVIAIVGYTNAGKSTLLNRLTDADILAEDKLFATLDPTTRGMQLPDGEQVLFTDTVGFIHKLPHNLIEAFRSTLEEAKYADILVHVVDSSNIEAEEHIKVVYRTLDELHVEGKPVVTLFNKSDVPGASSRIIKDTRADVSFKVSAATGEGIEDFLNEIARILRESKVLIDTVFPYTEAGNVARIRKEGQLIAEEYVAEGVHVKAYIPKSLAGQLGITASGKARCCSKRTSRS